MDVDTGLHGGLRIHGCSKKNDLRTEAFWASGRTRGDSRLIFSSHGAGSEIMQRIAAPMIGGMLTAPLLVIPAACRLLVLHRLRALGRDNAALTQTIPDTDCRQRHMYMNHELVLESRLTCPHCGQQTIERMPTNACRYFHECDGCGEFFRPKPGHCCVFCSYGSTACPPVQSGERECCSNGRGANRVRLPPE